MEANQKSSLLDKAAQLGERLVEVGGDAARLKSVASHAVEDAVTEAKRFAKRGRYAAEDLIDDAAYRVKRDPFRSAMSMLNFYINRAGSNLSKERRARLEAAKGELRALFGK